MWVNSIARGNKLLQILTFDSCKTSPKVYSWDSSFPNKPVDGVSFNSKDSNSFLDRDVFSGIWNLKDDTRQSFFSFLCVELPFTEHVTTTLAAKLRAKCLSNEDFHTHFAFPSDF